MVDFGGITADIGIHEGGLIHISHMSKRFINTSKPSRLSRWFGTAMQVKKIDVERKVNLSLVAPNRESDWVCTPSIPGRFWEEFRHQAEWNSSSNHWRSFLSPGSTPWFQPENIPSFRLEVFRKIVRHELCHYHLYDQGKGYRHKDLAL